jgi:hypothetical protein
VAKNRKDVGDFGAAVDAHSKKKAAEGLFDR